MMKVKSIIAAVVLAVAGLCFTGCNEDDSNVAWSCIADISAMHLVGSPDALGWNDSAPTLNYSNGSYYYDFVSKDNDTEGVTEFKLKTTGTWDLCYGNKEIKPGAEPVKLDKGKVGNTKLSIEPGKKVRVKYTVQGLDVFVQAVEIN